MEAVVKYGILRENHLFSKVFAAKNRAGGRCVTVYILKDLHAAKLKKANPQKEKINRTGISVSKKIGNAVMRNRAKRIIREAMRQIEKDTPLRKGKLIVIVAKEDCPRSNTAAVRKELERAFEKLEMFK